MASPQAALSQLVEAVNALPTDAGSDAWSVPEAVLAATSASPQRGKEYVARFAAWARGALQRLPPLPRDELEATDFNDYYKVVMSRVQYLYAKSLPGQASTPCDKTLPLCCFQSQVRRRPEFVQRGERKLLGVFDCAPSDDWVGSFDAPTEAAFRDELRKMGARRFHAATLRRLLSSISEKAAAQEASLAPINDEWIGKLDGQPLFELLDAGREFTATDRVELKLVKTAEGQLVALAQGPWYRVTFVETALLQGMATFMTARLCAVGDDGWADVLRENLMSFACAAHMVQDEVHAPGKGVVSFFAGRRTPHPEFHLLQHLYLRELWGDATFTTSSLAAARVLDGMPLIGTWTHEG